MKKISTNFYTNLFLIVIIIFITVFSLIGNYQENEKEINLTKISVEYNLNQIKDVLESNDIDKIYLDKYYIYSMITTSSFIEKNLSSNIHDKLLEITIEFNAFMISYKNNDFLTAKKNIDVTINKMNILLTEYEKFADECFITEDYSPPRLKYIYAFKDINKMKLKYFK